MTTRFTAFAALLTFAFALAVTGSCKRGADDNKAENKDEAKPAAAHDDAAAANDPPPAALPTDFTRVNGAGYEGWISPQTSGDPYIPTAGDIDALEALTTESLAAAHAAGEVPREVDLSTYVRQYKGYRHDGGRFIEVEFICEGSKMLARKHVKVAAGYTCFVHALYRVDENTLGRWRVNPKRPTN